MKIQPIFIVALTMLLIVGCGGSGSDEQMAPPPPVGTPSPANQTPVANAGPDLIAFSGTHMRIQGMGSDSDGTIVAFRWEQLSGPTLALSNPHVALLTFTAPQVSQDSTIELKLTVTDNAQASHSDTMILTLKKLPTVGYIKGIVSNIRTGEAIVGATLVANQISAISDSAGRYHITEVPISAEKVILSARKTGFVTQYKTIDRQDLLHLEKLELMLTPTGLSQSIDPRQHHSLTTPDDTLKVTIPANTLSRIDNTLPMGPVNVSLTFLDPLSSREAMPGSFTASVENTTATALLESFGAFEVAATDVDGAPLKLNASVAFEAKALAAEAEEVPNTVPLYFFDASLGQWIAVNEVATRAYSGLRAVYQGMISRLGIINMDKPVGTVRVSGCVTQADGAPFPSAIVRAHATSRISATETLTDVNGYWLMSVPATTVITISGSHGSSLTPAQTISTNNIDIVMSNCLVASSPRATIKLSWLKKPVFVNPVLVINSVNQGRMEIPQADIDTWSGFPFAAAQQVDLWGMVPAQFAIKELVDGEYTFNAIFAGSTENQPVNMVKPYVVLEIDGERHEIHAPATSIVDNGRWETFKISVSNGSYSINKTNVWEHFAD